jgi:uncharacterized membrane protein YfcA
VSASIGKAPGPWYGVAIGAVIGTLGGLIGLGGAEFRLPVLIAAYGLAPRRAVPVNLAVSFVVLAAALPPRAATIAWDMVVPHLGDVAGMLAGAMAAAFLGSGVVNRVSERRLGGAIVVLLGLLGLLMIGEPSLGHEATRLVPSGVVPSVVAAAACGVVIGLVSSLLGVAGGELIIPALVLVFGVPVKLAGSMSILIGLPTIAVGLVRHLRGPGPLREAASWRAAILPLGAGSIVGAVLGGLLLGLVPGAALKVLLGLVLLWSAWRVSGHLKHSLS